VLEALDKDYAVLIDLANDS